ncbi:hypothetical protein PV327_000860 [Microctonus hyperodae]|uniref:Uncharacterized protein n=1 Tax=Microctonus hyperodae TaxID=165561 RepID=A0AA39G720_MICHY|nr:hypothetical protein PV327_000860 [Microctonus hyperodae]
MSCAAWREKLLKDRYKSLQQRSIIAPSTRVLKRNKGKKKYIKADHKITMTPTKKLKIRHPEKYRRIWTTIL